MPRPLPWPSFLRDGDGERLTSSCRATQGMIGCCLPWEQLSFHKISSVCKTTYTAAHQWDPGILVGILHVPYLPCFQRVCMFGSITANTYAYCWKGPQITEIGTVDTCSLLSVPDGLFRKAAAHSCKDDHKDGSYYQYEVRHNTSFITPFLPACVVFSMVNQLWHSSCLFSIAPWKSWRRYGSGALLGFQTNASMQALVDARRGTCVELRLLVGSWPSCYGTGVQLNQQTAEMRNLNNEQLVEVTLLINNLDMVELAYCSPRLQMFIGMSLTRMIWSLAWLSNYHGEFVHTDCRMIKASKYKMEEQQKLGGIGLHSCSPHSAWLPNNIGAQYKKHNAEDTALVLGHEQNTTAFVVLDAHPQWDPGRFLSTICGDNKTNHLERRGCRG